MSGGSVEKCFISSFLKRFADAAEADHDAADVGLLDIARGNTRVASDESAIRSVVAQFQRA